MAQPCCVAAAILDINDSSLLRLTEVSEYTCDEARRRIVGPDDRSIPEEVRS
jgi:hypothetical protein